MPANSLNRETLRDALAAILQTALVGAGKPADAVYGYLRGDLASDTGAMPLAVVMIDAGGITRQRETFDAAWGVPAIGMTVETLVLYSSDDATETAPATWTEANCADRCDLLEKSIADALMDNYGAISGAEYVTYAGPTTTDYVVIGGRMYRRELIPLVGVTLHG